MSGALLILSCFFLLVLSLLTYIFRCEVGKWFKQDWGCAECRFFGMWCPESSSPRTGSTSTRTGSTSTRTGSTSTSPGSTSPTNPIFTPFSDIIIVPGRPSPPVPLNDNELRKQCGYTLRSNLINGLVTDSSKISSCAKVLEKYGIGVNIASNTITVIKDNVIKKTDSWRDTIDKPNGRLYLETEFGLSVNDVDRPVYVYEHSGKLINDECGKSMIDNVKKDTTFISNDLPECKGNTIEWDYSYTNNELRLGLSRAGDIWTRDSKNTGGKNAHKYISDFFRLPGPPATVPSPIGQITAPVKKGLGGLCTIPDDCEGSGGLNGNTCLNGFCRGPTFGMNDGDSCASGFGGSTNCRNGLECDNAFFTCRTPVDIGPTAGDTQPTGDFASS